MNKLKTGARYLFGALWILFSLNFFFHFLPQPPPPEAGLKFMMGLMANPVFFPFMKVIELLGGLLLVANVAVPLALVVLAPITVNIVLYHGVLDPAGLAPALVMLILHLFLGYAYFNVYRPLFKRG